jgi:uncharacterized membrane protein HdeD (DUF308 family)
MSTTASPQTSRPAAAVVLEQRISPLWWLWLVTGIAWLIAALVILQFNTASVNTVGLIIGGMLIVAGAQELFVALAGLTPLRWLWAIFGGLFVIGGLVCMFNPGTTFAATADVLGFIFLMIGIWWTISAFVQREENPVWWLTLVSGILMFVMAFWTSGQFFISKAYTLLVFAGIWSLMHGVTDIVRAFQIRRLAR